MILGHNVPTFGSHEIWSALWHCCGELYKSVYSFHSIRQAFIYMAFKHAKKNYSKTLDEILQLTDSKNLNKYAIKAPNSAAWVSEREHILYDIIQERYLQHPEMKSILLQYDHSYPIYMNCNTCSYFCTGIKHTEFRWIYDSSNHFGRNEVGVCYMDIRQSEL